MKDNQSIAESYNRVQHYLSGKGWYIGGAFHGSTYLKLDCAIKEERQKDIEEFMQTYARSVVDKTQAEASHEWPQRAHILEECFDAHRQGKYVLSVPVFLSQADGIYHEITTKAFLFTGHSKRKRFMSKFPRTNMEPIDFFDEEVLIGCLHNIFLEPLKANSSIQENTEKRGRRAQNLNRHGVLHGIDVDYPTEANSLRGILLIKYLLEAREALCQGQVKSPGKGRTSAANAGQL